MAKFAVIFFAALACHAALAAPKGKGAHAQPNQLEQVATQIQTAANDITAALEKALPDTKTLAANTQQFTHEFEGILKKLQTEIDNNKGKTDDTVKQISAKLGETITSLQQLSGPEATAKANELKTKVESTLKTAAADLEELGKAVQPNLEHAGESVNTFFKGVFDDFLKATQTLQTNVEKSVNKN